MVRALRICYTVYNPACPKWQHINSWIVKGSGAMDKKENEKYTYEEFLEIIARLRAKDGCPWDWEQTHESLKNCMIEEAYEAVEAIDLKDDENLKEELGDVLLQIVMHAQIAGEERRFDMTDVIDGVARKMIRRHPHIFGDVSADSSQEVLKNWEEIKKQEKNETSVLEGVQRVPKALPANIRAQKVLKKAAAADYGPADLKAAKAMVQKDFSALMAWADSDETADENGDFGALMLSLINLSRFLNVNAENSLTNAIEKFINRLGSDENLAKSKGLTLSELNPHRDSDLRENVNK